MDEAHQAPLCMGFFRQAYWRRLLFPPPQDHPDPGIEPTSPAQQADSLPLWSLRCCRWVGQSLTDGKGVQALFTATLQTSDSSCFPGPGTQIYPRAQKRWGCTARISILGQNPKSTAWDNKTCWSWNSRQPFILPGWWSYFIWPQNLRVFKKHIY